MDESAWPGFNIVKINQKDKQEYNVLNKLLSLLAFTFSNCLGWRERILFYDGLIASKRNDISPVPFKLVSFKLHPDANCLFSKIGLAWRKGTILSDLVRNEVTPTAYRLQGQAC